LAVRQGLETMRSKRWLALAAATFGVDAGRHVKLRQGLGEISPYPETARVDREAQVLSR
jgi:hypothetical protein